MKNLLTSVSTTLKAFKLLSNPAVIEMLHKELGSRSALPYKNVKLGINDIYHHKYYMVQVIGDMVQ